MFILKFVLYLSPIVPTKRSAGANKINRHGRGDVRRRFDHDHHWCSPIHGSHQRSVLGSHVAFVHHRCVALLARLLSRSHRLLRMAQIRRLLVRWHSQRWIVSNSTCIHIYLISPIHPQRSIQLFDSWFFCLLLFYYIYYYYSKY